MKKKLSVLLLGAMLTAAPFIGNATLTPGQRITINGHPFIVMLEPDPSNSDYELLELLAEVEVITNPTKYFGGLPKTADGKDAYTLQYDAPFDLGISALLGAGAIVAGKRARNRRKAAVAA